MNIGAGGGFNLEDTKKQLGGINMLTSFAEDNQSKGGVTGKVIAAGMMATAISMLRTIVSNAPESLPTDIKKKLAQAERRLPLEEQIRLVKQASGMLDQKIKNSALGALPREPGPSSAEVSHRVSKPEVPSKSVSAVADKRLSPKGKLRERVSAATRPLKKGILLEGGRKKGVERHIRWAEEVEPKLSEMIADTLQDLIGKPYFVGKSSKEAIDKKLSEIPLSNVIIFYQEKGVVKYAVKTATEEIEHGKVIPGRGNVTIGHITDKNVEACLTKGRFFKYVPPLGERA